MFEGYMRVNDIAKFTGLSVHTVYDYARKIQDNFPCPAESVGTVLFWKRKDIEKWHAKRAEKRRR